MEDIQEKEYRVQTATVSYPTGTAPGVYRHDLTLDTAMERREGILATEISDGGIPYYRIGVRDDFKQQHDFMHKDRYMPVGVAPGEMWKADNLPVNATPVYIETHIPATTTAELSFEFAIKLSRIAK